MLQIREQLAHSLSERLVSMSPESQPPATLEFASVRSPGVNDSNAPRSGRIPRFLTVDEVADLLRVNRKTVYDAINRGKIPGARRVGNAYRVARDAFFAWFGVPHARQRPKPKP